MTVMYGKQQIAKIGSGMSHAWRGSFYFKKQQTQVILECEKCVHVFFKGPRVATLKKINWLNCIHNNIPRYYFSLSQLIKTYRP